MKAVEELRTGPDIDCISVEDGGEEERLFFLSVVHKNIAFEEISQRSMTVRLTQKNLALLVAPFRRKRATGGLT